MCVGGMQGLCSGPAEEVEFLRVAPALQGMGTP